MNPCGGLTMLRITQPPAQARSDLSGRPGAGPAGPWCGLAGPSKPVMRFPCAVLRIPQKTTPDGRRNVNPMTRQARNARKVLRSFLTANPGRFAGGSAVSDPLGLLAVERERLAALRSPQRSDGVAGSSMSMAALRRCRWPRTLVVRKPGAMRRSPGRRGCLHHGGRR